MNTVIIMTNLNGDIAAEKISKNIEETDSAIELGLLSKKLNDFKIQGDRFIFTTEMHDSFCINANGVIHDKNHFEKLIIKNSRCTIIEDNDTFEHSFDVSKDDTEKIKDAIIKGQTAVINTQKEKIGKE